MATIPIPSWTVYRFGIDMQFSVYLCTCLLMHCSFQPFTSCFPQADINELLSPHILHQLVKGTFKDHLVTWMTSYIKAKHLE